MFYQGRLKSCQQMFTFTTQEYISNMDQVEVNDTWSWLFDQSVKHGYDSQPMVPFLYEEVSLD